MYVLVVIIAVCPSAVAESVQSCPGGVSVSAFKLTVEPPQAGSPLPVNVINVIKPGEKLRYEPVHLPANLKNSSRVAVILVPPSSDSSGHVQVLEPKPAKVAAEWPVTAHASAVGLVFGEHGLNAKKVSSMMEKNPQLVLELADYAEKTSTVEALVQTLTKYEQAPPGSSDLDSVLRGFSSQYGVSMPKIDASTSPDQTASSLLHAVVPAFASSGSEPTNLTQQSTGLAASVAAMFLGNPVGLAAGGAALVENLHKSMFPATDFLPAFAQPENHSEDMNLCTAKGSSKPRDHVAYLWMVRLPDADPPSITLPNAAHLPVGWTGTVKALTSTNSQLKLLSRVRDWKLVASGREIAVPVKVASEKSDDLLTLDLTHVKAAAPGEYKLAGLWDWTPVTTSGTVDLHSVSDLSAVKVTPESQDRLVAGTGVVPVKLTGADFEFVDSVSLTSPAAKIKSPPKSLEFDLPKGKQGGEQDEMQVQLDTSALKPGAYVLALKQLNGTTHDLAVTVHPPNPKLDDLPLNVNIGEKQQAVHLRGSNLERITRITSPDADWILSPTPNSENGERDAVVKLNDKAKKGETIAANLFVSDINAPLIVPDALRVLGPRPRIAGVSKSFATDIGVEVRPDEIPAGLATSFAIRTENVESRPTMSVQCSDDNETKRKLTLTPGQQDGSAQLQAAGQSVLFLSLDPGAVGESGCILNATVTASSGSSDAYSLGHVILLPRIEKLNVTDEKLAPNLYAGTLTGRNLQVIAKTGWDGKSAYDVQGIPTPVPGSPEEQTLKIAVPWPPPAPHAPLRIWLQGEDESRATTASY